MARRPVQHEIADQGVAEIVRILTNAGWTCERVQADYGEDLLCQTSHTGFVDPHRILVQIKSTKFRFSRRVNKVKIQRDTLIKWLSDSNLVIICLWSIADKTAVYLIPEHKYSLYEVDLSPKKDFIIELSSDQLLNESVADRIAWMARCRNINRHFLATKNALETAHPLLCDDEKQFYNHKTEIERDLLAIIKKFTIYLGLMRVSKRGISFDVEACAHAMMGLGAMASNKETLKDLNLNFDQVIMLIILLRAKQVMSDVGVPHALLEESMRFYSALMIEFFRTGGFEELGLSPTISRIRKYCEAIAKEFWLYGSQFTSDAISSLCGDCAIKLFAIYLSKHMDCDGQIDHNATTSE